MGVSLGVVAVEFSHQLVHQRRKEAHSAHGLPVAHSCGSDNANGSGGLLRYTVLTEDYAKRTKRFVWILIPNVNRYVLHLRIARKYAFQQHFFLDQLHQLFGATTS